MTKKKGNGEQGSNNQRGKTLDRALKEMKI